MKYFLIQFAAALPLLVLTVWALMEAPDSPAPSTDHRLPIDVAAVKRECQETEGMVEKDLPLAKQLLAADMLDVKPFMLPEPEGSLKQLVASWNQAKSVREMAGQVSEAQARIARRAAILESPLAKTEAEVKDWEEFLISRRSLFAEKHIGADEVLEAIQEHCRQLVAGQERLRKNEEIAKALAKAAECLDYGLIHRELGDANRQKVEECLEMLKAEPLRSAQDAQMREKIDLLRRRGRYREDWYKLFTGDIPPAREQLKRVREFLEAYREPPTEAEAAAHQVALKQLDRLRVSAQIDVLGGATSLDQLISHTETIFRQKPTDAQRQLALKAIRKWLGTKGLPKIEAPADLRTLREAVLKGPERCIGFFLLSNGNSPQQGRPWRYWSRESERWRNADGYAQFPRDQVTAPPDKPYYVKLADEYELLRLKLIGPEVTRDTWSLVPKPLEEMQNELSKYRADWDVPNHKDRWDDLCRNWTLEPAILTARQMLEHWDRYQALFREDAAEAPSLFRLPHLFHYDPFREDAAEAPTP